MSNLTINERFKDISIPRQNEDFYSNIKKFFGEIIKFEPKILNQLDIIKKGVFLEEESFDFLIKNNSLKYDKVLENGYEETDVDNFHNEPYNGCSIKRVNEIKNHKMFSKTISYKSNSAEEILFFEQSNNEIFVFKNNKKNLLLEIKCVNGELIDFGFDEKNFLYILYKNNEKINLIKTHKTYSFFTKHDELISILDLENCESFYNIKNISYAEEVSKVKYINYNPPDGTYGQIPDSAVTGYWKRYRIKDLIGTKIIAVLDGENRASNFTLLKELSDKIKKYPFRLIGDLKYKEFTSSGYNVEINNGNNIGQYYGYRGSDSKDAMVLFGSLSTSLADFNVVVGNSLNINLFTAIDFYEFEENKNNEFYVENYFNIKYNYNNYGNNVNNLLYLKPGFKYNVFVDINRCFKDEEQSYPYQNYMQYKQQIISNKIINETNQVQKITFYGYGNNLTEYKFDFGYNNYWIFYKIEKINETTNESTIEYLSQKVILKTNNLENMNLENSKMISDNKNNIYFVCDNNKLKINPIKKYYFLQDGIYYYNHSKELGDANPYRFYKQIEHLFLYELIRLYGLENFKAKGVETYDSLLSNISSENNDDIKNLFKFKFDNTLNGVINLFEFSKTKNKQFVNIDNGKFTCRGNSTNKNGECFLTLKVLEKVTNKEDSIKLEIKLEKEITYNNINRELIDTKVLYTTKSFDGLTRSLFYLNLEFYFYNFEYQKNEEFTIYLKEDYAKMVEFVKCNTYVENTITPGIEDLRYKVHNKKGIVINNNKQSDKLNFRIEDNYLIFENIELSKDNKLGSKLNQDNFKIPLLINNKATNSFKTINKKESFYVEYEKLTEFESSSIKQQILDDKEIILILDN